MKRIRNNPVQSSIIIDGLSSPEEIAIFCIWLSGLVHMYINYDYTEMQGNIRQEFNDTNSKRIALVLIVHCQRVKYSECSSQFKCWEK